MIEKTAQEQSWAVYSTPNETQLEHFQVDVEQFLTMLRFENRSKLEELTLIS